VAIVLAYKVCNQTKTGDLTSSKQQIGIMYEDEELRLYLVENQYFVEKVKANNHEVLILMDANRAKELTYQPQAHTIKLVTKKGFHVDGAIDGYLQSFMQNYGLINVLRQMHEGVAPSTHARGSVQIDFPFITSGLAEHVLDF
jgi:hypothetical protein